MSSGSQSLFPIVLYRDANAAIAWLESAFGFELLMLVPNEDGTVAHAEISFAGEVIMLGTTTTEPTEPFWRGVYVCVDDIDAHFAQAVEAGASIERPPSDTDYGSRDYWARDLEGYIWHFGTYRP